MSMDNWLANMEKREQESQSESYTQQQILSNPNIQTPSSIGLTQKQGFSTDFRENYSDEELKIWLSTAENIGVDFKNLLRVRRRVIVSDEGLEFNLFFSPKREARPNQLEEKAEESCCNMGKEISRWEKKKDNMLDGRRYGDYLICSNLYPISTGHVVLIQKNHNKRAVNSDDLKEVSRFGTGRGYGVWHNMEKAASTMPHDHFQAIPINFPIERLKFESYDSDLAFVKDYPGDNKVFIGERRFSEAESQIRGLDRVKIPYTIIINPDFIYIVPIRVPQYKGGLGGFETALNFVAKSWEEYVNTTGNELQERLKDVLFEPGVPAMVGRLY